jgi:hypothetical protein
VVTEKPGRDVAGSAVGSNDRSPARDLIVVMVTAIMGVVVGLTFLFGFGRSRRVRGFLVVCGARTRW